jgi:hypothetical protein
MMWITGGEPAASFLSTGDSQESRLRYRIYYAIDYLVSVCFKRIKWSYAQDLLGLIIIIKEIFPVFINRWNR